MSAPVCSARSTAILRADAKKQAAILEAEGQAEAILKIQQDWMPGCEKLNVGERVVLTNPVGQPFPATVIDKDEFTITFDANHEMAGKELNFKIELVEIV